MYRNVSYGASSVSLIIILLLVQVWDDSLALVISLYCSCISLPMMFGLGSFFENYILIGKQSYPHFRNPTTQGLAALIMLIGAVTLLASVGAIIYYLESTALWAFVISAFIALGVTLVLQNNLANYLFKKEDENT